MNQSIRIIVTAALCMLLSTPAWAGALIVPNTFTAGTPAVAADVNANFTATKTAVDDNDARITSNAAVKAEFPALTNATGTGIFNTAYGMGVLLSNTTGSSNTAMGANTLQDNTFGTSNTAVGANALLFNTSSFNTATGANALIYNTLGGFNTATGADALQLNSSGSSNTATGASALQNNLTGDNNTATGVSALAGNTTGSLNTAMGSSALFNNTTGADNTATGAGALAGNTTGSLNTAMGSRALFNNTTGYQNTASGVSALSSNTFGSSNTAYGYQALLNNINGWQNTATGEGALLNNTTGIQNTATGALALSGNIGHENTVIGFRALQSNTDGSWNTAIGTRAGTGNIIGSGNVFLGYAAGVNETGSNRLYIANNPLYPLIYGDFAAGTIAIGKGSITAGRQIDTSSGGYLSTGGAWINASSRSKKEQIQHLKPVEAELALDQLTPVRFRYKNSPDEEYVGFIAEDVPELVAMNDRKSLSAMDIVAVLTHVVKAQKQQITVLEKGNTELKAWMEQLNSSVEMLVRAMAAGDVASR